MYEILKQVKSANSAFYRELVLDLLYSQPCSQESYQYLRYLYRITNGAFNREVNQLYSLFRPKKVSRPDSGILCGSGSCLSEDVVQTIEREGICVFPFTLDRSLLNEIYNFAMGLQVTDWEDQTAVPASTIVSPRSFSKARYSFNLRDLVKCNAFQQIIFDRSLLYLAQEYLSCTPVLDNICMWFSVPVSSAESAEIELARSAQKFHYDQDRIKFIKFFIYFNEIDATNGPFTYIKGSHHSKPSNFRDGRYEDTEIDAVYDRSRRVEVTGSPGTIIACDTSGFHKGKPLEKGFRLILQLEYAVSLFGASSISDKIEITKNKFEFVDRVSRYKECYSTLFDICDKPVMAAAKNNDKKVKKHFAGAPYNDVNYIPSNNLNKYYSRYVLSRQFKWSPKSLLNSDSNKIFTIGSCFANELRAYLDRQGGYITYPSFPKEILEYFHPLSKETTSWGEWDGSSNFQHYNTFSIRQEIEKAAGIWTQSKDDFWKVSYDGNIIYQDPYRRKVFASSINNLFKVIEGIDRSIEQGLRSANIAILTLGLVEVWRKKNNGLFSCCEPGYGGGGGATETEFYFASYQENYNNVYSTIKILTDHFKIPNIVITVSPVPLGRTFRNLEIAAANVESKSILRAVAGQVSSHFENVHYFPSYEMAIFDRHSYREDGRHIEEAKVSQIMNFFSKIHLS